jgi:3-oxoacyl-[acyl-carrier-protein] synthase-3
MIRDIGVVGMGLWDGEVITNEVFPKAQSAVEVRDPYRGCRGDDGVVRVAGAELVPGKHDRTIAAVEYSFTDPFRGARRRRWFPADLPVSDAETEAATKALSDAGLTAKDVDALLVHSFLSDGLSPKNSPLVAHKLGITNGLALEVDSVCNSALSQMMFGSSLIATGQARNVLCVQSIAYSRLRDPNASTTFFEADMASAYVLGKVPGAEMSFSWRTAGHKHAAISLGWRRPTGALPTPYWEGPRERLLISFDRELQKHVNTDVAHYAQVTCSEALGRAEVELRDVDLFVSHQPMSWYTAYMEDSLGLRNGIAFSTFEEYANINSPSVVANLFEARRAGRLARGSRVLSYCPAAGYTYGAVALRW